MRLMTLSESCLSELPCCANVKHATDDCDSFLGAYLHLRLMTVSESWLFELPCCAKFVHDD